MNTPFDKAKNEYGDPIQSEGFDMQLVLSAVNRIAMYGIENATYFRPFFADHFLQYVEANYPEEIVAARAEFEIWLRENAPNPEPDDAE